MGQASLASVPSCPLQGELEAFVIGGAGLAIRPIHPLWMKGEEAPLLGGTLHGFIVSIQSLLAGLLEILSFKLCLSSFLLTSSRQSSPLSAATAPQGPTTSPPALKDRVLFSRQTLNSYLFILRISLPHTEKLLQMSCCRKRRLDLPVRCAKAYGGPGQPTPKCASVAHDYFELTLLKKQPSQEEHPESLSVSLKAGYTSLM